MRVWGLSGRHGVNAGQWANDLQVQGVGGTPCRGAACSSDLGLLCPRPAIVQGREGGSIASPERWGSPAKRKHRTSERSSSASSPTRDSAPALPGTHGIRDTRGPCLPLWVEGSLWGMSHTVLYFLSLKRPGRKGGWRVKHHLYFI